MTAVHRFCQGVAHGRRVGRCSVCRRAEWETRAGVLMILARTVAVSALVNWPPAVMPMARVMLNAIAAATSHAALAGWDLQGWAARC